MTAGSLQTWYIILINIGPETLRCRFHFGLCGGTGFLSATKSDNVIVVETFLRSSRSWPICNTVSFQQVLPESWISRSVQKHWNALQHGWWTTQPPAYMYSCAQARSIGDNYGIAILKVAYCYSDPNADIEPPCSFGVENAKTPFTPKPKKWPSQLRNPQQIFIFMALTVLRWVVGQIITWEQNFWTSLISLCPVYTVCQSDYVWSTADHPISQELQA